MYFALLLAAIIHDFKHPGVSHSFLVESSDELALTYNDRSPLENMHVSEAFRLMRQPGYDIMGSMEPDDRKQVRKLVINMVLSTDMTVHFSHLKALQEKVEAPNMTLDLTQPDDRSLVLETALHTADLNGPASLWDAHRVWTDRVNQEFFGEGDKRTPA